MLWPAEAGGARAKKEKSKSNAYRPRWPCFCSQALALDLESPGGPGVRGNGANAFQFTVTCGGDEYTLITPAGPADVGQIVGSTRVNIPLMVVVTKDGETVDTFVYGAGHGEAQGLQDAVVTCTAYDAPYTITSYGFFTPR